MKKNLMIIYAGLILMLSPWMQSCIPLVVGAAAGVGGYAYYSGALVKNLDYEVKEVDQAAAKALRDLGYSVTSDELNAHDAKIRANDPQNKKVLINIQALTERASRVEIRAGVFGDKEKSLAILNAIEAHF